MPRGDGTGPRGTGAGTGRGLGGCRAGNAGAPGDRGAGFPGGNANPQASRGGRPMNGRRGIGRTMLDGLYSWFERISRR